jgi:hypothetical protein
MPAHGEHYLNRSSHARRHLQGPAFGYQVVRVRRYSEKELDSIYQRMAPHALLVPWNPETRVQGPGPDVGVYLRYSDVVNEPGDVSQRYLDLLKRTPAIPAIGVLSMISGLVGAERISSSLHGELNRKFLPEALANAVARTEEEAPASPVVFTRLGCLHAIRDLMLYGSDRPSAGSRSLEEIGELVLCANEFLHPAVVEPGVAPDDLTVAHLCAPTWDIYNPTDLAYSLIRMYQMLFEILPGNDREVRSVNRKLGLDAKGITIGGLGLPDFIAVVFGLFSAGRKMTLDIRNAVIDSSRIFEKMGPSDALAKFVEKRSLSFEEYRKRSRGATNETTGNSGGLESGAFVKTNLNMFRQYPLLRIDEARLLILDIQFLAELLYTGVYWSIFDGLPKSKRPLFRQLWGRIFELYVVGLLSEYYPPASQILRPDVPFEDGKIDALLDFGPDVIVFEIKSSLLSETAKRGGVRDKFEQEVLLKFVHNERGEPKAVEQLVAACKAIEGGSVGTTINRPQIYPIILSDEPVVGAPCFNSYLNETFWRRANPSERVKPLTVMSVDEMEGILGSVSAGTFQWTEVLNRRFFDGSRVAPMSVHQAFYELLRKKRATGWRTADRTKKFKDITAEILSRYKAKDDKADAGKSST